MRDSDTINVRISVDGACVMTDLSLLITFTFHKTVLFAGVRTSATDDQLASCELSNPVTISSLVFKCLNERRFFHTATLVSSTAYVLMCGGIDSNKQILASCERYKS